MQGNERPTRVVSTRIRPPSHSDRLISRDRLIGHLLDDGAKRLTLIQGPAGFGKTTLALQCRALLRAKDIPVAWLSLDRDDGDVNSLLAHLIAAVRRVEPDLQVELESLLELNPADAGRYVLTELVNQLADN